MVSTVPRIQIAIGGLTQRVGPRMAQRARETAIWRFEFRNSNRNDGWLCVFGQREAFVPVF